MASRSTDRIAATSPRFRGNGGSPSVGIRPRRRSSAAAIRCDARVRTTPGKPARIDLRVELTSDGQLQDTIDQIRSMADVLDIARTGTG